MSQSAIQQTNSASVARSDQADTPTLRAAQAASAPETVGLSYETLAYAEHINDWLGVFEHDHQKRLDDFLAVWSLSVTSPHGKLLLGVLCFCDASIVTKGTLNRLNTLLKYLEQPSPVESDDHIPVVALQTAIAFKCLYARKKFAKSIEYIPNTVAIEYADSLMREKPSMTGPELFIHLYGQVIARKQSSCVIV